MIFSHITKKININKNMKKFILIIAFLTEMVSVYAQNRVPPTPVRGGAPPPGLPIDQYLIILFVVGIVLVLKYKNNFVKLTK